MKTRAAVAFEAKKPLEIVELDLEGPKAGEVLVEIKATGICHTDAYTLDGFDSEGIFPSILGPRRCRHRPRGRRRRALGEAGRSRDPALHAGMPPVQKLPEPEDQSVHRDPRHPGQGRDAGRHLALQPQGQADLPLHGLLDVLEFHRAAGDRGRQNPRGRAVRQELLHRLRRHHRRRRRGQYRQGHAGVERGRVRTRRHRSQRDPGRQDGRRRQDRRRRHQRFQGRMGPPLRHDPFRQPDQGRRRHRPAPGRR